MTTQPATAEVAKLESMERAQRRNLIIQYVFMVLLAAFFMWLGLDPVTGLQSVLLAAALATGLSSLGAGIAVASVGSAAIGAIAEKPELLGRTLIMVGLAEGIAIYGLIISILIFNRIM